jgi:hypothetical protein
MGAGMSAVSSMRILDRDPEAGSTVGTGKALSEHEGVANPSAHAIRASCLRSICSLRSVGRPAGA